MSCTREHARLGRPAFRRICPLYRVNSLVEIYILNVSILGIGYFTLPYLIHGHAKKVYACEWNPDAVEALKRNLLLNKCSERCEVLEGDNRLVGLFYL